MPSAADPRLTFRPARAADLAALVAMEQHCFTGDRLSVRSFRRQIHKQNPGLIIAARDNRQLAGYVLVLLNRRTTIARLYSIATAPAWRGRGLGEQLLGIAEEYAVSNQRLSLRLEVRRDNHGAIRLYQRLGYRLFGQYEDYYQDHEVALRFEKQLTGSASERQPASRASHGDQLFG